MIVQKRKVITIIQDEEIDIKGATLLASDKAEVLPLRLRKYHDRWWLHSPGFSQSFVACVFDDGSVRYGGGRVCNDFYCVRPILIINLKSSNLKIGDVFVFGDKEFEIISDTIAFCKSDIGEYYFRKAFSSEDANDYEASDVKKFVDKWFEEAQNGSRSTSI